MPINFTRHRILALLAIFVVVSLIVIGNFFPSTHIFKCEGTTTKKISDDDIKIVSLSEHISIKKYFFGYAYAINNLKREECRFIDDEIECLPSSSNSESWIAFNLVKGTLSGSNKSLDLGLNTNLVFFNLDCKKVIRTI
jgi:hypothetical protein